MKIDWEQDPPILDYAKPPKPKSPAELAAEENAENERRKMVANYNLSTFGSRSPFKLAILNLVICLAIVVVLTWIFPGRRNPIPGIGMFLYIGIVWWYRKKYG